MQPTGTVKLSPTPPTSLKLPAAFGVDFTLVGCANLNDVRKKRTKNAPRAGATLGFVALLGGVHCRKVRARSLVFPYRTEDLGPRFLVSTPV